MSDMSVRTICDRPKQGTRRDRGKVDVRDYNGTTRKGAYSEEPGGAYASDTSPCEDHGHIRCARAKRTPHEEKQQRELKPEMASINVGDGGKKGKEDGGGEEIRCTDVAGVNKRWI